MREKIIKLLIYIFICCAILALAISLDQDNIAINIIKDLSLINPRQPSLDIPIDTLIYPKIPGYTTSINATKEKTLRLNDTIKKLDETKNIIYGTKQELAMSGGKPSNLTSPKTIPIRAEDYIFMQSILVEYKDVLSSSYKFKEDCMYNVAKLTKDQALLERKVSQQGAIIDHNNNIYRLLSILIITLCDQRKLFSLSNLCS